MYAGETPVFQNDFIDNTSSHTLPPIPGDLDELPAVIMTAVAVPEPGTLAGILAAGLVALAAHYVARTRADDCRATKAERGCRSRFASMRHRAASMRRVGFRRAAKSICGSRNNTTWEE